jgi:hypothetical protein
LTNWPPAFKLDKAGRRAVVPTSFYAVLTRVNASLTLAAQHLQSMKAAGKRA